MHVFARFRLAAAAAALSLVAACSVDYDPDAPSVDLNDFSLGHLVVIAEDVEQGPFSRKASEKELEKSLEAAIRKRLGGYQGKGTYHIGVKIAVYALAAPGVPLVFEPKSVLGIVVNVWDDATQKKLNPEPKQFTVFEGVSAETLVGSGLTQSKEEQLAKLSANAAGQIQKWLAENKHWFKVK